MRHTDAEINRFASATARKMSDGCSKTYHQIKQSVIQQLKEARDAYPDEPEDPPDMSSAVAEEYNRMFRSFFKFMLFGIYSAIILVVAFFVYATITGAV